MSDVNIAMWAAMEREISKLGDVRNARQFRHRFFNSGITDEVFELVWSIFSAEARTKMEAVYEKFDVDPNVIRKEAAPRRTRMPAAPKSFKEAEEIKKKARARKSTGTLKKIGDLEYIELDEL